METFDWIVGTGVGIPVTVGLAGVALLGYLFGRRTRQPPPANLGAVGPRELHRAARVARQLEDTVEELRRHLAEHNSLVDHFKSKIAEAVHHDPRRALEMLSSESEQVLIPTLRLTSRLSHAYDELRQQSQVLSNFTEGRTDPLTGLGNTPALEEQLEMLIADRARGGAPASLALLNIQAPTHAVAGGQEHREFVKQVARQIESSVRQDDFIARLGGSEFAVLMPKTTLTDARLAGARLRKALGEYGQRLSGCGLAEALPGDTAHGLLSRADSALYSACAEGPGAQYLHTGARIEQAGPLPGEEGEAAPFGYTGVSPCVALPGNAPAATADAPN